MPVSPGDKLGPYEVIEPIGKGGMGEVYRARDTRLGREVAIKVSAQQFSERFEREARAISSLNHPNICTLYDVGPNYLVMEMIEGPTLAQRIKEGAIPLEEALSIARQVAAALDAAHGSGITHRDLKPGNIKIKPDGAVKVLDFGLAKVGPRAASGGDHDAEESPTISMAATRAGVILGTAAYMSPEQARGKNVDKRADIWAFGVVLYEMVTGKRLFQGEDLTDTLASVVKSEADLGSVPPRLKRLLKQCLEKDPAARLRDIGDVWHLLEEVRPEPETQAATPPKRSWLWPAVAAVAAVAALVLAVLFFTRDAPERDRRVVAILAPEGAAFDPGGVPQVSPDGRYVAFRATLNGMAGVWVRDPDSLTPRLLPGTEGANLPFWSADSRSLAFVAAGQVKRVDIAGGPVITLCATPGGAAAGGTGRGGSWSQNGVILFTTGAGGVFRVAESGGAAVPITQPDAALGETIHRSPWFLPDGRHFLFTAVSSDPNKAAIYVADVEAGPDAPRRLVVAANSNAAYAWPGYLLYVRDGTLMAQPFDPGSAETTGTAAPVAERVDYTASAGLAQFSASQNGVLVYTSGGGGSGALQLTWYGRTGGVRGALGEPGTSGAPAISRDGNWVATERRDPQTRLSAPWRYDLRRGFESRFAAQGRLPVWSPDGSQIAFSGNAQGLYRKAVSGAGDAQQIHSASSDLLDWSGDYLLERRLAPDTLSDIWLAPLSEGGQPTPLLNGNAQETFAKVSLDGRWLAYTSDESGRPEVFVTTFPAPSGKWQISTSGGSRAVWSRDGKELFYAGSDESAAGVKMMAVQVRAGAAEFDWGPPAALFDLPLAPGLQFDVHPDGRFLVPVPANREVAVPITMVLDWPAGLR